MTDFETVPPGETEEIDSVAALTVALQDKRAAGDPRQDGKVLRGVHAKSHGCVSAAFIVNEDLPEDLRVGLFETPGRAFAAHIRFSNASVTLDHDLAGGKNGSRGMAVKVFDVDGPMLDQDDGRNNQDFLMINTPEFAFANVRDYHRLNKALMTHEVGADPSLFFAPLELFKMGLLRPDGSLAPAQGEEPDQIKALRLQFGPGGLFEGFTGADLARTLASLKIVQEKIESTGAGDEPSRTVRNPLHPPYFGAAPFLFGEGRAMQFSAAPCPAVPVEEFVVIDKTTPPKDYLRAALTETMGASGDFWFDFRINVRAVGEAELNIEDATKAWPEAGYVNVARIRIPAPQSPDSDEAKAECEAMAFTPWHALAAHKPIGGINRMRRKVYANSAEHRGASGYEGAYQP